MTADDVRDRDDDVCPMTSEQAGHVHRCAFPTEHTDWDRDGSHQCVDCDATW